MKFFKKDVAYLKNVPIGVTTAGYSDYFSSMLDIDNKPFQEFQVTLKDLALLLYDPHIYAVIQSRKSAVLSLEYELLTDDEAKKDFILKILERLDLRNLISEILDAVLYGYKPIELFWDFDGENVVLSKAVGKPPYWFQFDDHNRLKYYTGANWDFVPINKFLIVQHEATYDNPYGVAILSNCLKPYIYKKGAMQLWAEFTQKYGSPFLIGKADASRSVEELEKLNELLQDAKRNFTAAIPDAIDIQTIETDRTSASDLFQNFIHFLNSEISKTILSQTLTTEQGDSGSYAMSQTHLQIRSDIVQADKYLVQQTLNELIRLIIDFNFADNDYPTIRFYEEEDIDMQLVQRDQILSQIITFTPEYIKKTYGFTDEDFAMKTAEFAESTPKPAQLDTLSEFAEKVINLAMEKIKAGNSLDEVLQSITDLYPGLPREDLENYMSNAIFLAEAGGMLRV